VRFGHCKPPAAARSAAFSRPKNREPSRAALDLRGRRDGHRHAGGRAHPPPRNAIDSSVKIPTGIKRRPTLQNARQKRLANQLHIGKKTTSRLRMKPLNTLYRFRLPAFNSPTFNADNH
jgi:hypothetical protein